MYTSPPHGNAPLSVIILQPHTFFWTWGNEVLQRSFINPVSGIWGVSKAKNYHARSKPIEDGVSHRRTPLALGKPLKWWKTWTDARLPLWFSSPSYNVGCNYYSQCTFTPIPQHWNRALGFMLPSQLQFNIITATYKCSNNFVKDFGCSINI